MSDKQADLASAAREAAELSNEELAQHLSDAGDLLACESGGGDDYRFEVEALYTAASRLRAQSAAPVPLTPPTDAEVEIAVDAFYGDNMTDATAMRAALTTFIASRGKGNQK